MTASHSSEASAGRLGLAELIDVEVCLRADGERTLAELIERDAQVTAAVDLEQLDDRALIGEWVRRVRGEDSVGARVERFRRVLQLALAAAGLAFGFFGVAAWLSTGDGIPVNVVVLWPALVGIPALFALGWVLAALPGAWLDGIPGVAALREGLANAAGFVPGVLGAGLARLGGAGARRALGELRRIELLYGRLRFWVLTSLTQAFALGFTIGATAALVGIPYVDDPAFGWRSRLMAPDQLHATAAAIATPWARFRPLAVPSEEQVVATRYSSVDPRFVGGARPPGGPVVWAAWWPFLVASLFVYGFFPRLLTTLASYAGLRRALRRAPLDDAGCRRLVARLRRTLETRSEVEAGALSTARNAAPGAEASTLAGTWVQTLRWAGVELAPETLCAEVKSATGAAGVAFVGEVGGLDPGVDQAAIRAVPATADPVALVVDGWEWPVSDHSDFARELRHAIGPNRAIFVLLRSGQRAAPVLDAWRIRLGSLGDPWLSVAELV